MKTITHSSYANRNYLTFPWEMNEIEETGNTSFIHVHSVGDN